MLHRFTRLGTALVVAVALSAGLDGQSPAAPAQHWLLVSDIHFDPFADAALVDRLAAAPAGGWEAIFATAHDPAAGFGSDTNDALLESSLAEMRATTPDPSVVLIDGDFLAHRFRDLFDRTAHVHTDAEYRTFVDKTIAFLALRFADVYPHAMIVPSVGNNDSYCGDYMSTPNSPFLAHMAAAWRPLVERTGSASDFAVDFPIAGHFVATVPGTPVRLVVPNSVVWSANYTNRCGDAKADPTADELQWFATALHPPARDQRTWVVTHIPPGVDVFSSLNSHAPVLTYSAAPAAQVPAMIDAADTYVSTFIAGHLHTNGFRIISGGGASEGVPVVTVPSISPIFANEPSYFDATVSTSTGTIVDYTAYALGGILPPGTLSAPATAAWGAEYTFSSAYDISAGVTAASLETVQEKLAADTATRLKFETYFVSGSPVRGMTESNWRAYWCSDTRFTAGTWAACAPTQ